MKYTLLLLLSALFFFSGCAPMQVQKSRNNVHIDKKETIGVIPFYNYTQTPLAGYSAAALANVTMQSRGYHTTTIALEPNAQALLDDNQKRKTLIRQAKQKGLHYLLTGEVTEWRYKVGVDAEPTAGLIVKLIDLQNGQTLYSAAASKSELGNGSITQTAQTILKEIIPQ